MSVLRNTWFQGLAPYFMEGGCAITAGYMHVSPYQIFFTSSKCAGHLGQVSIISDDPVQLSCRVSKMPVRSGQTNICGSWKVGRLGRVDILKPTELIYNTVRTRPFSDLEISQGVSIWTWNVFRTHQSMTNSPTFSAR